MRYRPSVRGQLVLFAVLAAGFAQADGTLEPQRARWSSLEFTATKLLLSAQAQVSARIVPAATVAPILVTTPVGRPVAPGTQVLELIYRASGFGRESVTTLWADPGSGAMLQQVQSDENGRLRQRTYRFTDIGAYHYTRRPADRGEESLQPQEWTELSEGLRSFSTDGKDQPPVTAATTLLWMVSAAQLAHAGDRLDALTFSRRHLNRVTIEVTGRRGTDVNYIEQQPAAAPRQRRGKLDALVLRLQGRPLGARPENDEPFELLGLSGDLELLLDPETRVPLQLRGRIRIAGDVTVRLHRAVLR